jgi:hypothetical protein
MFKVLVLAMRRLDVYTPRDGLVSMNTLYTPTPIARVFRGQLYRFNEDENIRNKTGRLRRPLKGDLDDHGRLQDRAEGQIPGHRLRQISHRRGRPLIRKARWEKSRLRRQGRDRLVANRLRPNQETA